MKSSNFQVVGFDGSEYWHIMFRGMLSWKNVEEIREILSKEKRFPLINYSDGRIPKIPLLDSPKKIRASFFGTIGSGKTTQAKLLANITSLPYISVSDIAIKEVQSGSELGRKIKPFLKKGSEWKHIPGRYVAELLKDLPPYFILDGFPLDREQYECVALQSMKYIFLDTPFKLCYKRMIENGLEHRDIAPRISIDQMYQDDLVSLVKPIRIPAAGDIGEVSRIIEGYIPCLELVAC